MSVLNLSLEDWTGGRPIIAYLTFVPRILAAYVLIYAAVAKGRNTKPFSATIRQLGVPETFASTTAVVVACAEGLVGAWLAVGILGWQAGIAALVAVLIFAGASVTAMRAGLDTPCNCFGTSETRLGKGTLVHSALLGFVVVTYLVGLFLTPQNGNPQNGNPVGTTDYLIGLTMVGGIILGARWASALPWITELVRARRRIDLNIQGVLSDL